ncbi:hypothetical protein NQ314_015500 [Rhamnusium bicolor]|uniref:Uncharacterized protein n=1 Tax=Rhamnusium bicolor TaxID=1586634 RepID=A0AAV8WXZ6_9CUCU|nr:hypothetical protein NQ314_015500 [Rhamnusium bicolor]
MRLVNENGGTKWSIKAVQRRVGEALKIDEKTLRKIAKNDKESVELQASVKRNRKKVQNRVTRWCKM